MKKYIRSLISALVAATFIFCLVSCGADRHDEMEGEHDNLIESIHEKQCTFAYITKGKGNSYHQTGFISPYADSAEIDISLSFDSGIICITDRQTGSAYQGNII
jgi:hypothetical protein